MAREYKIEGIGIIGAGYVGINVAAQAVRVFPDLPVVVYDIDQTRIDAYNKGHDPTGEIGDEGIAQLLEDVQFTTAPATLQMINFNVICVPTPTRRKRPVLDYVESASQTVGRYLRKGGVVVLESTVHPTTTRKIVKPILEQGSRLKAGKDFALGYSPERIDPGNPNWNIRNISKLVAGYDDASLDVVTHFYDAIVSDAKVVPVSSLETAEMSKILENTFRDSVIALVGGASIFCRKLGLSWDEVRKAMATKPHDPLMNALSTMFWKDVGGHCIPEDPYYLIHLAQEMESGRSSEFIHLMESARTFNERAPEYVVEQMILDGVLQTGRKVQDTTVLFLGGTYKPNVPDARNNNMDLYGNALRQRHFSKLWCVDPLLSDDAFQHHVGRHGFKRATMNDLPPRLDIVVVKEGHQRFRGEITLGRLKHAPRNVEPLILVDNTGFYSKADAVRNGVIYLSTLHGDGYPEGWEDKV